MLLMNKKIDTNKKTMSVAYKDKLTNSFHLENYDIVITNLFKVKFMPYIIVT